MKLEEALPYRRESRKIRRKSWGQNTHLGEGCNIAAGDINADDWELVPIPPVEIDVAEYADGYEFVFGDMNNCCLSVDKEGKYSFKRDIHSVSKILGTVYMDKKKQRHLNRNSTAANGCLNEK